MKVPSEDGVCFEPDQPSGWDLSDFTTFADQRPWRFARTMPSNPHEYTMRGDGPDGDFDCAVRYIREHGRLEYYRDRPYKTLYSGNHKFWTMGAPLDETVLINRKPRLADTTSTQNQSTARDETLGLEVVWDGPFTSAKVISQFSDEGRPPDYDGEDYGLYQIYGKHILSGPDTLLYIGQATGQTFSRRFRQHQSWLSCEEGVAVYLGRMYDPNRHTPRDLWNGWATEVRMVECLLIYKYSPNYNSMSISDPPPLGNYRSVEINHRGERHNLHPRDLLPKDWL